MKHHGDIKFKKRQVTSMCPSEESFNLKEFSTQKADRIGEGKRVKINVGCRHSNGYSLGLWVSHSSRGTNTFGEGE